MRKLRLAKLLRERFGVSSEKLRREIEQLELMLSESEQQIAEATPPDATEPAPPADPEPPRRNPARRPLPETLPRGVVEHAAPCASLLWHSSGFAAGTLASVAPNAAVRCGLWAKM